MACSGRVEGKAHDAAELAPEQLVGEDVSGRVFLGKVRLEEIANTVALNLLQADNIRRQRFNLGYL